MSKYDFEVDLGTNTSTGIILNKIAPHSTVLEFGCATGRMTKYMKNVLDCQVYIVEYDKEAFDVAIQYAVDGVCDDILLLSWMEKFRNVRFDAILFADVLEHLAQPGVALSAAAEVLKDNGHIYVSIPNITHNDIILKALNNHFDYMNLGILDDTHVHFWGYENIIPFAKDNGLVVDSIDTTNCPTGHTEQYINETLKCSPILLNYLNERKYAEVYQFIVVLEKQQEEDEYTNVVNNDSIGSYITSHLYIDNGNDFDEKNIIAFRSENIAPGRYIAHYVLNDTKAIKRLRFDPVELQGCIVQNFSARQEGRQLEFIYSDHLQLEGGVLMLGTDPMVLIDVPSEIKAITIDADIIVLGDEYFDILQKNCIRLQSDNNILHNEFSRLNEQISNLNAQNGKLDESVNGLTIRNEALNEEINNLRTQNERLNGAVNNLNVQNERLNGTVNNLNVQNEKLNGEINDLNVQNERLNEEVSSLNKEVNSLNTEADSLKTKNIRIQSDIGAYILLVNKKDELLITKDRILNEKDSIVKEKDEYIKKLEERVDYFENRTCVKICNKFWEIYWKIRLGLRKLVGKKENNE